ARPSVFSLRGAPFRAAGQKPASTGLPRGERIGEPGCRRRTTMLARLPLDSASARLRMSFVVALLASFTVLATPALGQVWPVDGAPLCKAPGDQHGLFYSTPGCNTVLFGWIASGPGRDSLASGDVGPNPPSGECASPWPQVDAPGVSEPFSVEVRSPQI